MLRVLTDPGFRADPDKLAGVLLAEWSAWDSPGDALGPALLEGNENLRKRPPGTTIWFSPSGLSSYPWYHHNSTPMFSVWLLLAALRDDVALPREAREARARSGRSVRHPGRAGPRALEKGGAASVLRGMAGGTNAYGQTARKGCGRLEQPHGHETHHSSLERRRTHRAQGPLAETGRHPLLGGPTDRGGPGRGRTARLRRLGARPCGRGNRKTHVRMMLASGAKPDLPDGNGMFPEEATRRSGASAELLRLLAAPPAANGRRARTVRPNGTNRHPRRPDPRPRFSTAAQRSNPEILQRNGSVSGKNRIRNRFVLSGLRENTPQRAAKP